nr:ABC transporter permease [uncultured Gellertiella sp.]
MAAASAVRSGSGLTILKTIGQRLGLGVFTLFVVSLVIFSLMSLMPGDFARSILGQAATPETVAAFQREIGLDHPPVERYVSWISHAARGDFGNSFVTSGDRKRAVADIIAPRLRNTLFLAILTASFAVPIAIGLGILTAVFRNSVFDRVVNATTLTTISMPEFFMAYLLLIVFSTKLHLLPGLATVNEGDAILEKVRRCALPAMTLTLVIVAHMMRMTRAALINVLNDPYMEMARFKGIGRVKMVVRHALPNAWAPIANVVAFNLAYLVVGVVIVEVVFAYPGIGQLMVDSVSTRDIPVVQACSLVFASVYILLNLSADILSILSNPRLMHPR